LSEPLSNRQGLGKGKGKVYLGGPLGEKKRRKEKKKQRDNHRGTIRKKVKRHKERKEVYAPVSTSLVGVFSEERVKEGKIDAPQRSRRVPERREESRAREREARTARASTTLRPSDANRPA